VTKKRNVPENAMKRGDDAEFIRISILCGCIVIEWDGRVMHLAAPRRGEPLSNANQRI
jgi:hypothetical protein